MSTIFAALNLADVEKTYVNTVGASLVFDAVQASFEMHNAEVQRMLSVFVERQTEDYTMRYQLPGGGELQELGDEDAPGSVKAGGYWDVAFPLRRYGAALSGGRVALGYLTVGQLERHLLTVFEQDIARLRSLILTALFENTNLTFTDRRVGSDLTIRRLANTDGTLYPPVLGSTSEADDEHYVSVEYDPASIDSTHDPVPNATAELVEHFGGQSTFGDPIVFFHNSDATSYLAALTGYAKVEDQFIRQAPGSTTDVAAGLPPNIPGRIHGRYKNAWLSEWAAIPAYYGLAVHLGAPRPLIQRVAPAATGLGSGLSLVARDAVFPLESAYYERHVGFGVGNRLNGYCVYMKANASGVYTPPTAYAE